MFKKKGEYDLELQKSKKGFEEPADKTAEVKKDPVSAIALFRFADFWDILFMVAGGIAAIVNGAALPVYMIEFGNIVDGFTQNIIHCSNITFNTTATTTVNPDATDYCDIVALLHPPIMAFVVVGVAVLVCSYIQVGCWVLAAERQCHRIRQLLFRSVLYQSATWYDTTPTGELSSRLAADVDKVQSGLGDKFGLFIQWTATGLISFIVGLVKGWKLSLVILSLSPLLMGSAILLTKIVTAASAQETKSYARAGAVAQEVFGAIRTVVAFGGEKIEAERYSRNLHGAFVAGVRRGLMGGLGMGVALLIVYASESLGFWYGAQLVRDGVVECGGLDCDFDTLDYTPGKMVTVFFCVLIGAFALGNAFPNLSEFSAARGAAAYIFEVIDTPSDIDASQDIGEKVSDSQIGHITLDNVKFAYPSRPEVPILQGLSLTVQPGQTVALVGASGCGKSTVVQLIQRFYDVGSGMVSIGGHNIKKLNVKWLRERIGVVSQEPVLFGTTISENIRYGRMNVTQTEIEAAAKEANAHEFIMALPKRYDTILGDRGAQLSGGQKQRVAIARALVRNPAILLLDEATSALDTQSEGVVQAALEKARQGRTTILVAHRLTTVQNADKIFVLRHGVVVESGSHDQLLSLKGRYYELVTTQLRHKHEGADESENEEEEEERIEAELLPKRLLSVTSIKSDVSVKKEKLPNPPMSRIMAQNAPEWYYIALGCFGALANGGSQPAFAIVFAEMLNIFTLPVDQQEDKAVLYALAILAIGVGSFIVLFLQSFMFALSGEHLTKRLRRKTFENLLRQEVSFFDHPDNSVGSLTTKLASDASAVNGATGSRIGSLLQAFGSLGIGLILAFIYGWKLTLVILAFIPAIAIAGALQFKIMTGFSEESKEGRIEAGKVATEAIDNYRTVASLGLETFFLERYVQMLADSHKKEMIKSQIYGFVFGLSQSVIYFAYAAAFYFGSLQVRDGEMAFVDITKVFGCVIFSSMAMGQALSFAPDYTKAVVAAAEIFRLIDRKSAIDPTNTSGVKLESNKPGAVEFKNLNFVYPNRPTVTVLNGLNLTIFPGQTVALVGASGCGKSTCIQLLERFYDPVDGYVLVNGHNLPDINISELRRQFGLVSQEPTLFDRTIADNIRYGANHRDDVTMEEIIDAARQANIHDFITSLPRGYETPVGDKGAQLSGGQKQRVAIARALLRNPTVLLLDEATSALDAESEKVVQSALDAARAGRTCIVVAHRLSTIRSADSIAVISGGKIVELGSHNDLMGLKGFYYKLNAAQNHTN